MILAGFWLLLAGNIGTVELILGAVSAAVGATVAQLIAPEGAAGGHVQAAWLRDVPRVLWQLPADSAVLIVALTRHLVLGRPIEGRFRAVHFDAGGADPATTARRALASALDSVGPNSYVIGIDTDSDVALFHQLVVTPDPADLDPAGLR